VGGILSGVPRRTGDEAPEEIRAVAEALLALSRKEGLTRAKIASHPALLALVDGQTPTSTPEAARLVEDSIRTHVNAIRNLRDRTLLSAALNLNEESGLSSEARINDACYHVIGEASPHFLTPESARGRFRYQLTNELAWRLLGGVPTYASPRPPSDDLELAARLRTQHRDGDALSILQKVASKEGAVSDRRDAWRLIATIAYESGDYDAAEEAFGEALQFFGGTTRGGRLAMAIDRYARRLTDDEDFDRAQKIVQSALNVYLEGRWLWRRYGCIKWYAGELHDAYAALTLALDLGYPQSRIFHARGQVLAELGHYDDALEELDQCLLTPRSSLSTAIAKSAQGFATGMSGDLDKALRLFTSAEQVIPDSGWLHYWKGRCYLRHDGTDEATEELKRCLDASTPRANPVKRRHARELLQTLDTIASH
jgi:tetratricopeptide (TPR) repeat protein